MPKLKTNTPPSHRRKRNAYGLTTYRYLYSGNFSNITPRYWLAGMHSCLLFPPSRLSVPT